MRVNIIIYTLHKNRRAGRSSKVIHWKTNYRISGASWFQLVHVLSTCWEAQLRRAHFFFLPFLFLFDLSSISAFFSFSFFIFVSLFGSLEPHEKTERGVFHSCVGGLPPRANKKYHTAVSRSCHDDKSDSF